MSTSRVAVRASSQNHNRRQAVALLILGVLFLAVATLPPLLTHHALLNYPVGVLLLGVGMLVTALLNPYRLAAAGWMTTMIGVAALLVYGRFVPGNQLLSVDLLAVGLGLLGTAFLGSLGYARTGHLSPAFIVIITAAIEYMIAAPPTVPHSIPFAAYLTIPNLLFFALSFWLPGVGLFVLGLIRLLFSRG